MRTSSSNRLAFIYTNYSLIFVICQGILYIIKTLQKLSIKICDRIYIVPSAPKFSASILIFCRTPSLVYHQATFPFQVPHKSRHTQLWRYHQQQMHMIHCHFPFQYFYLFPSAQFFNDFHNLLATAFVEYFSPIFWRKHYVVLAIPCAV